MSNILQEALYISHGKAPYKLFTFVHVLCSKGNIVIKLKFHICNSRNHIFFFVHKDMNS